MLSSEYTKILYINLNEKCRVLHRSKSFFEAEYCLFFGRRRVAVARYRMVCLVLSHNLKSDQIDNIYNMRITDIKTITYMRSPSSDCFTTFLMMTIYNDTLN